MELVIGFLLASSIPVLFLIVIWQFDFYQTGKFQTILLSLILGGIAYAPAAITNLILINSGLATRATVDRFIAPVHEEIFKGLFLLYLVRRSRLTYSVDGALYGFAIGIGFAILENFENLLKFHSAANIVLRIFSTDLVHAFSSATIGIILGIILLETSRSRWLISTFGLSLAIGQHMLYNNVIYFIDSMGYRIHPFFTFLPGLPGMYFIYVVMQRGRKKAREWIKEKLGMADRVTRGEVAAVDRLANPKDVWYPVAKRFGSEKANQVEKLLYLQGRIGIKRKSLDSFQNNEKMRKAIEAEISEMQVEMEKIRRSIGIYVMLFVRGLFTEDMVSVWERMQAKIQERSAATGDQKGGGLWSSLEERVKS